MECVGRLWQLHRNYLHDNQNYIRDRKESEQKQEKDNDKNTENT